MSKNIMKPANKATALIFAASLSLGVSAEPSESEKTGADGKGNPRCVVYLKHGYHIGNAESLVKVRWGLESDCKMVPSVCSAYYEPKATCNKENDEMIRSFLKENEDTI